MGKKNINKKVPTTSQEESLKASKNNNGANNIYKKKNDLSDLVKVLRPKVYITDNSSFKRLVQDLTGNGSTTIQTSSVSSYSKAPILIDVDSESSFEASDSSPKELFDRASLGQESNQMCYGEVGLVGEQEKQIINGHDLDFDLFAYWDLESWLLNPTNDPYAFYDSGFDQFQNDVSIYDYGFSGML